MVQLSVVFGPIIVLLVGASEKTRTIEDLTTQPILEEAGNLTGQSLVDYVNKHQHFYKAKYLPFSEERYRMRIMDKKYMGTHTEGQMNILEIDEELPENFDARDQWPGCTSIRTIRDQSQCSSCWAVAAASTMSDRLCIQSKGVRKEIVSDTDILSCCSSCVRAEGCGGGWMDMAWRYAVLKGVCTGGRYKAKGVCKPYAFHPCNRHSDDIYYGQCPARLWTAPPCSKTCQSGYFITYQEDKIYAKSTYSVPRNERAIRKEIMTNGPVQAGITVYTSLYHYTGGIYVSSAGMQEGEHSVKIIGWGAEKGTKYWLVANSWNKDWGEDGYIRFLRGKDFCHIEKWVVAGMMEV